MIKFGGSCADWGSMNLRRLAFVGVTGWVVTVGMATTATAGVPAVIKRVIVMPSPFSAVQPATQSHPIPLKAVTHKARHRTGH